MLRWLMMTVGAAVVVLMGFAPYPAYEVVLDRAPTDVRVGVPFEVGFSIHAAEGAPPAGHLAPLVVARNPASREVVKVAAQPVTAPGQYAALLILPAAGRWQWEIYPEGESGATPVAMSPLVVGDPGANWVESSLAAGVLALLAAVTALAVMVGRLLRRHEAEVEYVRR